MAGSRCPVVAPFQPARARWVNGTTASPAEDELHPCVLASGNACAKARAPRTAAASEERPRSLTCILAPRCGPGTAGGAAISRPDPSDPSRAADSSRKPAAVCAERPAGLLRPVFGHSDVGAAQHRRRQLQADVCAAASSMANSRPSARSACHAACMTAVTISSGAVLRFLNNVEVREGGPNGRQSRR